MKILKVFLGSIVLVLILAFVFLQKDDQLSNQANQILNSYERDSPNDAYLYYLGIGAGLNKDPLNEGRDALKRIRESEALYKTARTTCFSAVSSL